MYLESELLPLSALQHLLFCPRQCALIHLEQQWIENRLTAEGRILHERVDQGGAADRGRIKVAYSLPIRSLELGLSGKADVVEFHREQKGRGIWRPFPVEYKRGRPKKDLSDKVQLCAQAMCLEEMLGVEVHAGALFYGKTRRRLDVPFDERLQAETRKTATALHEMMRVGTTPPAVYAKRCDSCSFIESCLPKTIGKKRSAMKWLEKAVKDSGDTE